MKNPFRILLKLSNLPLLDLFCRISDYYWFLKSQYCYKYFFGKIGSKSKIIRPVRMKNVANIFIGENVIINKYAFLLTVALENNDPPNLIIDNGATIGHFNHITCVNSVRIGKKVLTADKVHISDNTHGFTDVNIPILDQKVTSKGLVSIGDGTWIGEGVSILSAAIGKNCVIGSNAVVVKDIPDYCIAVGIPARIVKRYNVETQQWEPTTGDGKFICRPGGEI